MASQEVVDGFDPSTGREKPSYNLNSTSTVIAGYIGGNTLMEMGVAFYVRKPIYVLNPVSPELSYATEILGMKPVMLDEDLDKIPLK